MGENNDQRRKVTGVGLPEEPPSIAFGNFTIQEIRDELCNIRVEHGLSECYADWPQLQTLLEDLLLSPPPAEELAILVPACGYSRLSEHLYDAGFTNITNVDSSEVVISDMMRRNLKSREKMKWSAMDMTNMQFDHGTFDAIIDKGGLDALMEVRQRILYLSEVKRLLKAGGKYICLTYAETPVLGLLFSKFRFGWKVNLYSIAQEPSSGTTKQLTLMLVAEKYILTVVSEIKVFMEEGWEDWEDSIRYQIGVLFKALGRENIVRAEYSKDNDIWYSLEQLNQGMEGDIGVLQPGRIIRLFLGKPGVSRFYYIGVLIDARSPTKPFTNNLTRIPTMQFFKWILAPEVETWRFVAATGATRVLMVALDSSHRWVSHDDILKDLTPFLKQFEPVGNIHDIDDLDDLERTPEDAVLKEQTIDGMLHRISYLRDPVHVNSALTGRIAVAPEVFYTTPPHDVPEDSIFRCLFFQRSEAITRSEALLSIQGPNQTWKNGKPREIGSQSSNSQASSGDTKVDHKYLRSEFHKAMIAGLLLFSAPSSQSSSASESVNYVHAVYSTSKVKKTVIIGLGAGLLPMFMRGYIPDLEIEVVELDPVVVNAAKEYFGFEEDGHLQVRNTDAIKFVREKANSGAEGNDSLKVDVLIIDDDSSDSSSGLISPEADFVEESFLRAAKASLSDKGLFIVKLVTSFPGVRAAVYSNLRKVFTNIFFINIDTNFSDLIFALKKDSPVIGEKELAKACAVLEKSLERRKNEHWVKRALDNSKLIKPIRRQ